MFRCSFSEAIPIFFNRLTSVFSLSDRYEICLTMDDGRSALKALELDGKEVKKKNSRSSWIFAKITLFNPSILEVQEL